MTNLINHYKDKNPKETIQIIQKFFENKGLTIILLKNTVSEINTFSCQYGLYLDNIFILRANGKGMTKEYAQASGLAELYERFCVYQYNYFFNPFITNDIFSQRYKQKNYYFHPLEKKISINELLEDGYTKTFFNNFSVNEIQQWFDIYQNEQILGLPYYNLNNKFVTYKNPIFIYGIMATNGFASGNTLEEALVQGCCELYEREGIGLFYKNIQSTYYQLNPNNLSIIIQEKIKLMREHNLDCYIYDLSFNFNIPVCMLMVINKNNNKCYLKFGSHIILDIAIERCFTEFYQGQNKFDPPSSVLTLPYTLEQYQQVYNITFMHTLGLWPNETIYLPTFLLLNSTLIDYYNDKCFYSAITTTNQELLQKINLINQENHYEMLYTNLSIIQEIYTIQVIFATFNNSQYQHKDVDLSIAYKNRNAIYPFLNNIRNNKLTQQEILFIISYLSTLNSELKSQIQELISGLCAPYTCTTFIKNDEDYLNILRLFNEDLDSLDFNGQPLFENKYHEFILYTTLINQNYTIEQIQKIFYTLNYKDLERIKNLNDIISLIQFIFTDTIFEIYHSETYQKFLNLFI